MGLLLLFALWSWLALSGSLAPLDHFFLNFTSENVFWKLITEAGDYRVLSALALVFLPSLKKEEQKRIGYGFVSLAILVDVLKNILKHPRPIPSITYAYPSGHSTLGFFLYFNLYRVYRKRKFAPLFLLLSILVPLSRIVLGVHWFSDVAGGVLLAFVGQCFMEERYLKREKEK